METTSPGLLDRITQDMHEEFSRKIERKIEQ